MCKNNLKTKDKSRPRAKPRKEKGLSSHNATQPTRSAQDASIESQQLLLDVFKTAFLGRFDNLELTTLIQDVKKYLYNRDFQQAFGVDERLEAYSIRWSPGRALAYQDLICGTPELTKIVRGLNRDSSITCIGGGAGAEVVAFAGALRILHKECPPPTKSKTTRDEAQEDPDEPLPGLKLHIIDMADWSPVLQQLQASINTPPPLSSYASAAVRAMQEPLVPKAHLEVDLILQDILSIDAVRLTAVIERSTLVTLMLTLNELYSTSIAKTTNLLLTLTLAMASRTYLLIVDSPGSYSTIKLGRDEDAASKSGVGRLERKYPMQWLLDHTLLETSTVGSDRKAIGEKKWRKVIGEDAVWFRKREKLNYPIELEDMRYQMHLYEHL